MFKPIYSALIALTILSGCTSVPEEKKDERDPLQSINRPIYDFNMDVLDTYILRPAAQGYLAVTPTPVRAGLVNFTTNIAAPIDAVNAGLQGKPGDMGVNVARFLINSTVGVLGIFDVASNFGLEHKDEDFGQTLGVWGVGDGAYVMLPAMGPSTVRNVVGDVVDKVVLPEIALTTPQTLLIFALRAVEARASLMAQESLLKESLDPYVFMKDIYFQRQLYELHDGNPPVNEEPTDFDEDFLENL
ncbi:VacJ family lipoprotein [Pseudoalteromonas sp. MMG013]|uniref:Phospholipid-binding lipoprotein MlaA n=1 Tax=Pseudoalteromonas aurantia 208 TaxID=1314867 RepID=A0ABR9E8Z4_9GAMM|nr:MULTISPECIES: VacJ family lipoprotein [Pseudoalteromonas]MBE0367450.1 phospholipid-binding lipoprotein MlaA [Pseudoalteromonas aurantia 208]MBQ4849075.1 VacJ family lipoprotein [Pseudoalteromonas sp. MMG012]MBQ4861920.1 VacJ family lipoprotein [Pseudoalteromonas sp. MMG013]